jgi:hypothetical protein
MRKYVVDTNYLRSEKLREFLARAPTNLAVLTDYSAMEAHPGETTLITIFRSMEIVRQFPNQIVILKHSSSASRLRGRSSGLERRFIDETATRRFPEYCRKLSVAEAGDVGLRHELLEQGRISASHLDRIRTVAQTANFREKLKDVTNSFSANDLRIVRQKETFNDAMITRLALQVVRVAAEGFGCHRVRFPPAKEVTNTFLYRYALGFCSLAIRWASDGAQFVKGEKLRNDLVDLNFVSFATFFDGLLSADARAIDLYKMVRTHLRNETLDVAVRSACRNLQLS